MTRLLSPYGYKTIIRLRYLWACRLEEAVQSSCQETQCCLQTKETRGFAFYVLRLDIGVYHTDVNIKCYVKNVTKYVDINIFSYWKYRGYNMYCEIFYHKVKVFRHSFVDNIANKTLNAMNTEDKCGNKWSLFIRKTIFDHAVKERNTFTDDNFSSVKYNLQVAGRGWPALYVRMWLGVFVTYTLQVCLQRSQYETHNPAQTISYQSKTLPGNCFWDQIFILPHSHG